MDPANSDSARRRPEEDIYCRLVAGVDSGVYGALVVCAWFCLHSWLVAEPWFSKLNVAAAPFFGNQVFHAGLSWATLTGLALLIIVYGVAPALCSFLLPLHRGRLAALLSGLILAVLLHLFAELKLWQSLHWSANTYFPRSATIPGHFLYGLTLIRFPARYRRAGESLFGWPPPPPPPIEVKALPGDEAPAPSIPPVLPTQDSEVLDPTSLPESQSESQPEPSPGTDQPETEKDEETAQTHQLPSRDTPDFPTAVQPGEQEKPRSETHPSS